MTIVLNGTSGITTPPVSVEGSTSGTITLAAPAVAGTNTQTLVAATGTLAPLIAGTAVASTSGTSIDFTGIPSWVRRITVMCNGISKSSTANFLFQLGAGSVETTGYVGNAVGALGGNVSLGVSSTSGFPMAGDASGASVVSGTIVFTLVGSNVWLANGLMSLASGYNTTISGSKTTATTLDRVRITTTTGTDTFDAGTINILYE
jgi:hypothetical protein